MVVVKNPKDYKFIQFEKSHIKNKKYNAVIMNKKTKKLRRIPFGDSRFEQYRDSTGLGLYSHKNHLSEKRRKSYRARHLKTSKNKFSSSYFAFNFLW